MLTLHTTSATGDEFTEQRDDDPEREVQRHQPRTDAVQVFGGYGYTRDFAVERYMREAKITQIFEGTNQIQRLVISRGLAHR